MAIESSSSAPASTGRIVQVDATHLALLRCMRAIWVPIEAGVPYVSLDEPYGSADIAGDVARVIGGAAPTGEALITLHREALVRLPILISAGALMPGTYAGTHVSRSHIQLLKSLRSEIAVSADDLPFNFKRPYGDMTAIALDMAPLLGIVGDAAGDELSEEQQTTLWELHESLEAVLQVWLSQAAFEPGAYQEGADGTWSKIAPADEQLVIRVLSAKPKPDALTHAIAGKNLVEAKGLLEHSADPSAEDSQGYTPFNWAAKNHDLLAARLLLAAGMPINAPQGRGRWTPLALAAAAGASEIFDELLRRGADLSSTSATGTSVLGFAECYGHAAIVSKIEATGWTESGNLGVRLYAGAALQEAKRRTGVESDALIENVVLRSTADRLGIAVDDCIVSIDEVSVSTFDAIRAVMTRKMYGAEIQVAVTRHGERVDLRARVAPKIVEPFLRYKKA